MNKEPLLYTVEMNEQEPKTKIHFLVSCFEEGDQESLNAAILQMVTNVDRKSVEDGEPITSRSAINVLEPKNFPTCDKAYAHNEYTATNKTKILIKAYFQTIENELEVLKPFYGTIAFDDSGKFYLSLPKEVSDLKPYDGTLSE